MEPVLTFKDRDKAQTFANACFDKGARAITMLNNGTPPWTPFGMSDEDYHELLEEWRKSKAD